ncbi:alpha/beta fold hydrolase [Microvirga sp. 17 mud 1-3]|uniref:alpha/beta fold hydrolase n=1 Tax=Microvirga sp. 17 mud 1-3 TaxID=2082949 RepID=UPI000D6AD00F|nr:alpha/beta fold hydrolase [Microvirga sp. 17 mud 1-3]AWM86877.1 alpha/beta hydrolase [Microvirga sp. 17 mud 1-3]
MAETLVLIPGLANTSSLYEAQIRALSADWQIMVADHTQDDSLAGIAARLLADAPERFALAGLSMGGYVAMEVLRQAPERVERLALLNTSARPDGDQAREDRLRMIALAEAGRFEDVIARLWPRLVSERGQTDPALKERILSMMRAVGPEAYIRQQKAILGRPDSRPLLPGIEIPTLVLVGDEDAVTPPDIAREMAEAIEWASLVVVPGAGHLSTLERPKEVSHALRIWLEQSRRGI